MLSRSLWAAAFTAAALGASGCVVDDDDDFFDTGPFPPAGIALLYERCEFTADCDVAADACYQVDSDVGSGGMCSLGCFSNEDCPALVGGVGASCYSLFGDQTGTQICYEQCVDDFDCAAGMFCNDAIDPNNVVIDRICLPV